MSYYGGEAEIHCIYRQKTPFSQIEIQHGISKGQLSTLEKNKEGGKAPVLLKEVKNVKAQLKPRRMTHMT